MLYARCSIVVVCAHNKWTICPWRLVKMSNFWNVGKAIVFVEYTSIIGFTGFSTFSHNCPCVYFCVWLLDHCVYVNWSKIGFCFLVCFDLKVKTLLLIRLLAIYCLQCWECVTRKFSITTIHLKNDSFADGNHVSSPMNQMIVDYLLLPERMHLAKANFHSCAKK